MASFFFAIYSFFSMDTGLSIFQSSGSTSSTGLLIRGTSVVVFLCALDAAYVGYCFVRNSFYVIFPLRVLRVAVSFFTSMLFIPMMTILLNAYCLPDTPSTYCRTESDDSKVFNLVIWSAAAVD